MTHYFDRQLALKTKIHSGAPTLGLFVKTPAPAIVEVLAATGVDFIVLDAEHAPFSLEVLDACLLAARAHELPALVRVDSAGSSLLQRVLDLGAAGVVVPHIRSQQEATQAVAATRYIGGTRGFSAAHRAGGNGAISMASYCEYSDKATIVIGQIEDEAAIDSIDDIVGTDCMDALFIGTADLAISLGVNTISHPRVNNAVETVCEACRQAQQSAGIFLSCVESIDQYRAKGVNVFFISSDQALLTVAAEGLVNRFNSATR